jgi:hypothetical protein
MKRKLMITEGQIQPPPHPKQDLGDESCLIATSGSHKF